MNKTILLCVFIFLFLSGCGWLTPEPIIQTRTIEVKIPVYTVPEPPEFLTMVQKYVLPDFHGPRAEGMSSCINQADEEELKRILIDLKERNNAWMVWADPFR